VWLFDFDNTIAALERCVDWNRSREELEPLLRSYGVSPDLFVAHPTGNLHLFEATRAWLRRRSNRASRNANPEEILGRASAVIERHELAGVERAEPVNGADALLRSLARSGALIAVVTHNSSVAVDRWLQRLQLESTVGATIGRDSLLPFKPAPDMVDAALDGCNRLARDAIFVGDRSVDYGAAAAAGVEFVGIAPSDESRRKLVAAGARRIYADPRFLLQELRG
jgi:phosphoglycolate phosphatase-like HAD superfamily hydrolase